LELVRAATAEIESLRQQLAESKVILQEAQALRSRLAEVEAENARLVAGNKARDEFLRGHRYKHSEVDGYINLCESQIATLKARQAEADALLREIAGQRQAVTFFVPPLTGVIAALDRIDAHLARQP
jgi:chromosome segregation ATPase